MKRLFGWLSRYRRLDIVYDRRLGEPAQRRIVTALTETELQFSNPRTPSGMTLFTVWRRASPR